MTNLYLLEDLLADTCYCSISINEFGIRVKLVLQALYFVKFWRCVTRYCPIERNGSVLSWNSEGPSSMMIKVSFYLQRKRIVLT